MNMAKLKIKPLHQVFHEKAMHFRVRSLGL